MSLSKAVGSPEASSPRPPRKRSETTTYEGSNGSKVARLTVEVPHHVISAADDPFKHTGVTCGLDGLAVDVNGRDVAGGFLPIPIDYIPPPFLPLASAISGVCSSSDQKALFHPPPPLPLPLPLPLSLSPPLSMPSFRRSFSENSTIMFDFLNQVKLLLIELGGKNTLTDVQKENWQGIFLEMLTKSTQQSEIQSSYVRMLFPGLTWDGKEELSPFYIQSDVYVSGQPELVRVLTSVHDEIMHRGPDHLTFDQVRQPVESSFDGEGKTTINLVFWRCLHNRRGFSWKSRLLGTNIPHQGAEFTTLNHKISRETLGSIIALFPDELVNFSIETLKKFFDSGSDMIEKLKQEICQSMYEYYAKEPQPRDIKGKIEIDNRTLLFYVLINLKVNLNESPSARRRISGNSSSSSSSSSSELYLERSQEAPVCFSIETGEKSIDKVFAFYNQIFNFNKVFKNPRCLVNLIN